MDTECNRDDAIRSKEIAESKFKENDLAGAKKFALKAKTFFESLEGIDHMISALDTHIRAQTKIGGENDWYGILDVSAFDDDDKIKKQYKRLALQTHPDKNRFSGAEGAFNLISDAWSVLSDKNKKRSYDQKRSGGSSGVYQNSFKSNANGTPGFTLSRSKRRKMSSYDHTSDETIYKYDLVQVLDSYNPSTGISVMPIVKVPGFVSVFWPLLDPMKSGIIPKEEMLRFSHQVPFHVLTGEEAKNSPKGCYELDPGSTPKELLQAVPQS
uniref:J domain-containing protein n=1 Tax=Oryza brachyantha TaxID=4533 RepID=J3L7B2_ORYBR